MTGFIDSLFGIQTDAQKQQAAELKKSQQTQQRELFASQEQQAATAAETVASGRRIGVGRQALAFQGNTLGVLPDLTAGKSATAGS